MRLAVVVRRCRRRGSGEGYREMLTRMARESGIETPTSEAPAELIADKGYHSRERLKALDGGPWKSRISKPRRDGFLRWHGDDAARRAVYNNRTRLLSEVARQAFRLRAELSNAALR
jgi:hypothetical protein